MSARGIGEGNSSVDQSRMKNVLSREPVHEIVQTVRKKLQE